jgi:hypothetical protein
MTEAELNKLARRMTEPELRHRAKRKGHRLRRRGGEYQIHYRDGTRLGGSSLFAVARQFLIGELKLPQLFTTACGTPMFVGNVEKERRNNSRP